MLKRLSIKNYALIKQVDISFESGYSVITGETGAGKSIILSALGLILGNRLDTVNFKHQTEKCVIEGHFHTRIEDVQPFFEEHDFDFENETILRREINARGKSRMFLNDTPISLEQLRQFKSYVINIHSQHEIISLSHNKFQFEFLDAIAMNQQLFETYTTKLKKLKLMKTELSDLVEKQLSYEREKSFIDFQLNEIDELKLVQGEEKDMLQELSMLANAETLIDRLEEAKIILNQEDQGTIELMRQLCQSLSKLQQIDESFDNTLNRAETILQDLQEINGELEDYSEKVELNPERLMYIEERLGKIHSLNLKHKVNETDGLLKVKEQLMNSHLSFEDNEERVSYLKQQVHDVEDELSEISKKLHDRRVGVTNFICEEIKQRLAQLGIVDAAFQIQIDETTDFNPYGKNKIDFLFNANSGVALQPISKVASGGELSRLMLVVRALMAEHTAMPTMIFDEIDSGISGEIANKMALQLEQMSRNMQLIAITHSPQLASKGQLHYHVIKSKEDHEMVTTIKKLNQEERVVEIAKMLSGTSISDAAISNAKDLIKNN